MTPLPRSICIGFVLLLLCICVVPLAGQVTPNPVPLIYVPLVPTTVAPGGPAFTLTVNGTGFVSGSVVDWNGVPLTTVFVSSSQLTATVPAADIAQPGTASVMVMSPSPGGGESNILYLGVTTPSANVTYTQLAQNGNFPGLTVTPATGDAIPIVGDFNNDGKLDVAFIATGNLLCIELGNGDTSFQTPSCVSIGNNSSQFWLVAADFNHDGNLDLAVLNYNNLTISVFLGNGDGTLQPPVSYPAGPSSPTSFAVGDFNGDGKLDFAVISNNGGPPSYLSILLGNGDGTFQAATSTSLNCNCTPYDLFVADFNRDGKLDIAFADPLGVQNGVGGVYLALGNGDGTFQTPQMIVSGLINIIGMADLLIGA